MPFLGLGLHVLIALFFAVHSYRTGQNMYWLFILLAFPLLGSVVYFTVVYLPSTRIDLGAKKVVAAAAKVLDPSKELREAKAAFDYTPTAQNQMRLAAAALNAGFAEEAATFYQACLKGPFAEDPEIRYGAAQSLHECQRYDEAVVFLKAIRVESPGYRPEQVVLLLAGTLAGAGWHHEAEEQFIAAVQQFGSFQAHAEYAIWAVNTGDWETAERLRAEIQESQKRWNRHTRKLNTSMLRRVTTAFNEAAR